MYNSHRDIPMKNQLLAQPVLLGKFDINLGEQRVTYTLKRSPKAKLIWLDIKRDTGLTVTVPYSYNLKYLPEYLIKNTNWILNNHAKFCHDLPSSPAQETVPVNTIPYLGRNLKVMPNRTGHGCNAVTLDHNELTISLNSSGSNLSKQELEHWMRSQSSKLIKEKVEYFSHRMGLKYNRVVIRDQRSRWGSCSCLKNLNFNWRLIMAPEPVLDYVIIHELCHLKEMSHSKSFWNLVSRYCPQWHEHRDWLDHHCLQFNTQLSF